MFQDVNKYMYVYIYISITENKKQLDANSCFIILMIRSTCFGHFYAHHQELTTIVLFTTWSFRFLG